MKKKTNPHIGSDLDGFLQEEGILAEVEAAADKRIEEAADHGAFDPQGRPVDPLFGWTGERLKEYIEDKPLQVGDQMLIYGSYGMMHWYNLVTVEAVDHGRQRRVVVDTPPMWGGKSFYRSGKNCECPKGQARLIPPVPWAMEQLGEGGVQVTFGWDWKHPQVVRPESGPKT